MQGRFLEYYSDQRQSKNSLFAERYGLELAACNETIICYSQATTWLSGSCWTIVYVPDTALPIQTMLPDKKVSNVLNICQSLLKHKHILLIFYITAGAEGYSFTITLNSKLYYAARIV